MIASLPMYARPENRAAHSALWALIRDGLRARALPAPDTLDFDTPHMQGWARPDLVLGQICNLPYRAQFRGRVTLIGCFDYGLPDCPPGQYYSQFVVRRDDPAATATDCAKAGYVFAYNEGLSQSGWGAPQAWAAAQGLALRPGPKTGAHLASLQAVADGRADWAATDAITLRMAQRWQSGLTDQLRIVGQSAPSPGMTLITRLDQPAEPYATAITEALAQLPAEIAQILGICGFYRLPQSAYDIALPTPPDPA